MPCMHGAQIATTPQPLPSADELIALALTEATTPEQQVAALKTALVSLHTTVRGIATEHAPQCLKSTLLFLPAQEEVSQVAQTPGVSYVWMHSTTLNSTALFGYELVGKDHLKTLTEVHLRGMNMARLLCETVMGQLERELMTELAEVDAQGPNALEAQL